MFKAAQGWNLSFLQSEENTRNYLILDEEDNTLLHYACKIDLLHHNGTKQTIDFLKNKDIEINQKNKLGKIPLHIAVESYSEAICQLYYSLLHTRKQEEINTIKQSGKYLLQSLLEAGANIDDTDENNQTPLHIAASYGCLECCKILIGKDANVNARDKDGSTPLLCVLNSNMIDCQATQDQIVSYLLENNANISITNLDGDNALHLAIKTGSKSSVEKLLNCCMDPNAQNNKNFTPLHIAIDRAITAFKQNLQEKEMEIEDGNPNTYDKMQAPFHGAISDLDLGADNTANIQEIAIIDKLLEKNANTNLGIEYRDDKLGIDLKNVTPLHLLIILSAKEGPNLDTCANLIIDKLTLIADLDLIATGTLNGKNGHFTVLDLARSLNKERYLDSFVANLCTNKGARTVQQVLDSKTIKQTKDEVEELGNAVGNIPKKTPTWKKFIKALIYAISSAGGICGLISKGFGIELKGKHYFMILAACCMLSFVIEFSSDIFPSIPPSYIKEPVTQPQNQSDQKHIT